MKKYNLQEQIIPISSLESLFSRDILSLGIDLTDAPNNIKPEFLDLLNEYYEESSWIKHEYPDAPPIMALKLLKLEDDYANGKIKLKNYIKVNQDNGDVLVSKIHSMCKASFLECYVSIYIKPFSKGSNELEHIYLLDKTEVIVYKYLMKKRKVRSL